VNAETEKEGNEKMPTMKFHGWWVVKEDFFFYVERSCGLKVFGKRRARLDAVDYGKFAFGWCLVLAC
jgi:hypothetical protein